MLRESGYNGGKFVFCFGGKELDVTKNIRYDNWRTKGEMWGGGGGSIRLLAASSVEGG